MSIYRTIKINHSLITRNLREYKTWSTILPLIDFDNKKEIKQNISSITKEDEYNLDTKKLETNYKYTYRNLILSNKENITNFRDLIIDNIKKMS
tara:strand:- start:281 stop:562 length:282 start_codon:yes stop_codon:yes gene_type:complete